MSWVDAQLAVGGHLPASVLPRLRDELGITHVVDLRSERQDDAAQLRALGIELLLLPTDDHCAVHEDMLARGVAWVLDALRSGARAYIHCEHGIGRSVLLTWCLMVARGVAPRTALEQIKRARRIASPSPDQIHALLAFARPYADELPSWDELADIAYAHLRPSRASEGAT